MIKYNKIIRSNVLYEVESINKQRNGSFITYKEIILNIIIIIAYLCDAIQYHNIFNHLNIMHITVIEVLYIVTVILPSYYLYYSRNMKLILTDNGIALSPNKFILGQPIYRLIAEEWDDIASYSILELPFMMKLGSNQFKKYYLHVNTKGIIKRCVNNFGISVFAVTGHHLDEDDIKYVKNTFDKHGVKLDSK